MKSIHLQNLVVRYPALAECSPVIEAALDVLSATFRKGGKVLLCGNGGSAADAEHIAGELMKGFLLRRPLPADESEKLNAAAGENISAYLQGALPAVALTGHLALSTAISNDNRADMIFAQQVYGLGRPGDTLLGISTSGNSANVVQAFHVARMKGMHTISLTGRPGGRLRPLADVAICVPACTVVEVQEFHLPVYHAICAELEACFFQDKNAL